MRLTINIGLNNNAVQDIQRYFMEHKGYTILTFRFATGEYEGQEEETAVLELATNYKLTSKVIADFEKICAVMTQQCIAISCSEFDLLVYSPNFIGQKMKFERKYFIS